MKAGKELDGLIAKKLFGHKEEPLSKYSTRIDFAWMVVEKMDEKGWLASLTNCGSHGWRVEFLSTSPNEEDVHVKGAATASLGICLAALKALNS